MLLTLVLVVMAVGPDAGVPEILPKEFYARAARDPAPRVVTAEHVARGLKEGVLVLVDLRSKEQFKRSHIKGAINLPVTELTDAEVLKVLPNKDARVVTYCDDQIAPTRRIALTTLGVPSLRRLGYTHVELLENLWMRKEPGGLVFEPGQP